MTNDGSALVCDTKVVEVRKMNLGVKWRMKSTLRVQYSYLIEESEGSLDYIGLNRASQGESSVRRGQVVAFPISLYSRLLQASKVFETL